MRDKTLLKFLLDLLLVVIFLNIFESELIGATWHEILGLGIGVLFAVHLMFNWTWIKKTTGNLFNPAFKLKPKLFYVLNTLSFICIVTMMYTGIEISRVLFPSEAAVANHNLMEVHEAVAHALLGLFVLHIALHWRFIVNAVGKLYAGLRAKYVKAFAGAGVMVVVASLLYAQIAASAAGDAEKDRAVKEPPLYRQDQQREVYLNPPGAGVLIDDETYPAEQSQDGTISANQGDAGAEVSLNDYLGNLFCNGCSNHCSLLSPQCENGARNQELARAQYQQQYVTQN